MDIFELIEERGASLEFTDQPIDTTSPAGRMMLGMLSVFASFEQRNDSRACAGRCGCRQSERQATGPTKKDHSADPKVQGLLTWYQRVSP